MHRLAAGEVSVPVILDGVVATPQQSLAEEGPLIRIFLLQ